MKHRTYTEPVENAWKKVFDDIVVVGYFYISYFDLKASQIAICWRGNLELKSFPQCQLQTCFRFQIVISIYEVVNIFLNGKMGLTGFQPWARKLIFCNTLMVVINSSSNFAFYCGDVVFRECLSATVSCGAPICQRIASALCHCYSRLIRHQESVDENSTHGARDPELNPFTQSPNEPQEEVESLNIEFVEIEVNYSGKSCRKKIAFFFVFS